MENQQPNALGVDLSSQVKLLRSQRGWSLEELATLSGVSRSMLSQIERGEASPTVVVGLAISRALGVSLDELASVPGRASALEVIRGDESQYIHRADERCRIRTLSPRSAQRELEFYEIELPAGEELRSAPHFAGTHEFLTVQSGAVTVESGERSTALASGDSVTYPADVPHAIVNEGDGVARVYLIDTIP